MNYTLQINKIRLNKQQFALYFYQDQYLQIFVCVWVGSLKKTFVVSIWGVFLYFEVIFDLFSQLSYYENGQISLFYERKQIKLGQEMFHSY